MTHRTLQAVLRSLGDSESPATDADLLGRFVSDRDEQAFAALVDRHGRLVWTVCQHLSRSDVDADDAFQATFLVLIRNAAKIREAGKLSAWLHGVAYKVCTKARQSAQRRMARERASARTERNGTAMPDSAWDRALAAVHEEVAKLPETLRVPFVLCCLEGQGVTEAAGQLGWKLGTFSGRLTRAKDALLARLEARGVALGIAATATVASATGVPAAVSAKASGWLRNGVEIPRSILQLSQGVFTMSVSHGKLLAAAVLLACGLGFGGGAGWVATADAQAPKDNKPRETRPEDAAKSLAEAIDKGVADLTNKGTRWTTGKWEFDFVLVSDMGPTKFVQFLQDREARGWEYNGQSTLLHDGKPAGHWVFRRPHSPAEGSSNSSGSSGSSGSRFKTTDGDGYFRLDEETRKADNKDPKVIEAEIKRLQDLLDQYAAARKTAEAAAKAAGQPAIRNIAIKFDKPQEAASLIDVLEKSAAKQFGAGKLKVTYDPRGNGSIHLEGSTEAVEWASGIVSKLYAK